jgi:hypothetical protein
MSILPFRSFEEAHDYLGIPGNPKDDVIISDYNDIFSVKIIDNPYSYNRILQHQNIIWLVGIGPRRVYGVPSGNHMLINQEPFYTSMKYDTVFPVLRKVGYNYVYLMGNYRVLDIVKKISFYGFTYFHIKLQKASDNNLAI